MDKKIKDNEMKIGPLFRMYKDKKLGSGAFGEIYLGYNIKTNDEVAIKIEPADVEIPQLVYESKILKILEGAGIPTMHFFGTIDNKNYMVMDMLGANLDDLFESCNFKFSLTTILALADQILTRIEFMHSKSLIHRDIKPNNFLIGHGKKKHQLFMIDFGLAKRYQDPKTLQHIPYIEGKCLTGTARFVSIYTHLGIEQSRRDDLEALGYIVMYFYKGELPWQTLYMKNIDDTKEKYQRIMESKIKHVPDLLCKDSPEEFLEYFKYVRSLQFHDKPDYAYLKSLFKSVMTKNNLKFNFTYDWSGKNVKTNVVRKLEVEKIIEDKNVENIDEGNHIENGLNKEVKAEEVKAEEVKAEEVKAEEVKAEEVKAEEVKLDENKNGIILENNTNDLEGINNIHLEENNANIENHEDIKMLSIKEDGNNNINVVLIDENIKSDQINQIVAQKHEHESNIDKIIEDNNHNNEKIEKNGINENNQNNNHIASIENTDNIANNKSNDNNENL